MPFLKALADKTRWRMVQELLASPVTVSELAERLKFSQYNVSKHLRILREAGIVGTVKHGKHVHCQIVPDFQRRAAKNRQPKQAWAPWKTHAHSRMCLIPPAGKSAGEDGHVAK